MNILIVGGGGREHALAWRCAKEGHQVTVAPGSDGIASVANCVDLSVGEYDALIELAQSEGIDLVIVGPEQPLVEGLADRFRSAGFPTLGPSAEAAELEGSKAGAKSFMARHQIPTADFQTVATLEDGLEALKRFQHPPVIKANGLAAGKGVTVADTFEEAEQALRHCLEQRKFGMAGSTVVLEQRLSGEEASFFVLSDGSGALSFAPAQDHKRLLEDDRGPNTGGMGAYVPAPICDEAVREKVMSKIVEPTLRGLREEGRPFCGVLFIGLMIDGAGEPWVIEYNVRFGDPETQILMLGLEEDVVPHFYAAAKGGLENGRLASTHVCNVVMASAGYPESSTKGVPIHGLEKAEGMPGVQIFHAGTRREDGKWFSNGGRMLSICAMGDTLETAVSRAYDAVAAIDCEGAQIRRDIGARALK